MQGQAVHGYGREGLAKVGLLRPLDPGHSLSPPCSTAFVQHPPCHNLCFALAPTGIDRCAAGATNICGPGTCVNLPDGYRCVCSPGYQLHPSQAYCTGIHLGALGLLGGWGRWEQGLGGRVESPGRSRRSKQCWVVDEFRRSAVPVDKANFNPQGKTSLGESHPMSLQDSRSMEASPLHAS